MKNKKNIINYMLLTILFFSINIFLNGEINSVNVKNDNVKITTEEVKKIVFSHAKIDRKAARITKLVLDKENKMYYYEIIFFTAEKKYTYKINANTGNLISVNQSIRKSYDQKNQSKGIFQWLF